MNCVMSTGFYTGTGWLHELCGVYRLLCGDSQVELCDVCRPRYGDRLVTLTVWCLQISMWGQSG